MISSMTNLESPTSLLAGHGGAELSTMGLFVWSLNVLPVPEWVSSRCSRFFTQSKYMFRVIVVLNVCGLS